MLATSVMASIELESLSCAASVQLELIRTVFTIDVGYIIKVEAKPDLDFVQRKAETGSGRRFECAGEVD